MLNGNVAATDNLKESLIAVLRKRAHQGCEHPSEGSLDRYGNMCGFPLTESEP